jgi:hypothetical protein
VVQEVVEDVLEVEVVVVLEVVVPVAVVVALVVVVDPDTLVRVAGHEVEVAVL